MKILVVHSGGLDSTVLLADLKAAGHDAAAVSVNYGQRHARELDAAARVCEALGVDRSVVDLSSLARHLPGSSQTDAAVPVPEGHYADATMRATVVPNRNMILLAVAAGAAIAQQRAALAYAAHAGDHAVYPDCRPEFVEAMRGALAVADYKPLSLLAPYLAMTKAQIVRRGVEVGAPMPLTWSCYVGGARHCGKCGTCVERLEAFHLAGVRDEVEYE